MRKDNDPAKIVWQLSFIKREASVSHEKQLIERPRLAAVASACVIARVPGRAGLAPACQPPEDLLF